MGATEFGNFFNFCRDSTLPVCNVLSASHNQSGPWGGCELTGIPLPGDQILGNLGSMCLCAVAIITTISLLSYAGGKKAAVGRREMQWFLVGYLFIEICEIFTVGEFPLDASVRIAFTGVHIGLIVATTWILLFNAIVAFQRFDDGTLRSIVPMLSFATVLFVITGYVTLDTGFGWTVHFSASYDPPNKNIGLYFLYQFVPLAFLVAYYVLEAIVALKILRQVRAMIYLTAAAVLFVIGQICNYVISPYICRGTTGKIDGSLLETLFTLLSVVMVYAFWDLITSDEFSPQSSSSQPLPEMAQRVSSESQREREAMVEIRETYINYIGNQVGVQRSSSSHLPATEQERKAQRETLEVAALWLADNSDFRLP